MKSGRRGVTEWKKVRRTYIKLIERHLVRRHLKTGNLIYLEGRILLIQ